MKKVTMTVIALAGLALLASCKKDNSTNGIFRASIEQQNQNSKTAIDTTGTQGVITWTASDMIRISNGSDVKTFTLVSGQGSQDGTFSTTGDFDMTGNYTAAYPSTANIDGATVTFSLPAIQAMEDNASGTFANGANPMAAVANGSTDLAFKNPCGGLGIRLKGATEGVTVNNIRITSNSADDALWGSLTVTMNADGIVASTAIANESGTKNVIDLSCNVALSTTDAKRFFVVLPEGALSQGFTLEVTYNDTKIFTKSTGTTNIAEVERNMMKSLNPIAIGVETPPALATGAVTITDSGSSVNTATGHVTLTNVGNIGDVTEIGLCWGTTDNPEVSPTAANFVAADGHMVNTEYTVTTPLLVAGTTYYFRSYAKIGDAYYYADNEVSVKTYYLISTLDDWNSFAAAVNNGTDATAKAVQMANISGVTTMVGNTSNPFKGKYNGQGYTISNVNISGTTNVGLFGYVNSASAVIENVVVASGMVSGSDVNVGAVVGQLSGGTVRYCANYAEVGSSSNPSNGRARVGGIVGMQSSGGGDNNHVSYCINYGYVHGKGYVGGIVGGYGSGYISCSQNYGLIRATNGSTAGGVAGWQSFKADKLTNSHNGGNIQTSYASDQTSRSRYLICNNTLNNPTNTGTLNYPSNTYLYTLSVTLGSTTYTESGLPQFETGATHVTSNPEGITIGGTTYSWNTPAP